MKYIPYLTIQKELDVSESPEYQRIKYENSVLQAETARHVVERSELQELRARLEKKEAEDKETADKVTELALVLQQGDPKFLTQLLNVMKTAEN